MKLMTRKCVRRMPYDALRESQCHRPDRQHGLEQNPDLPVCEYFHTAPLPIPFIAHAADSQQHLRFAGVVLNLHPQPPDVHC